MTNPFTLIDTYTFTARVQALVQQKSRFVSSGALVVSPALSEFCETGSGYDETAVALTRTQSWSTARLDCAKLEGTSPEESIANRIADYEAHRLDAAVLSILSGVFGGAAGHLTVNVSGSQFVMMSTNFTVDNLEIAERLVEATSKMLHAHSAVFSRMRKNNLLDYTKEFQTGSEAWTLGDTPISYSDDMPKLGNVYHSYVLTPGALELGWGSSKAATEVVFDAEANEHILTRTWKYAVHPRGFGYNGPDNPANAPLAEGASWKKVSNQATMSRLITREA